MPYFTSDTHNDRLRPRDVTGRRVSPLTSSTRHCALPTRCLHSLSRSAKAYNMVGGISCYCCVQSWSRGGTSACWRGTAGARTRTTLNDLIFSRRRSLPRNRRSYFIRLFPGIRPAAIQPGTLRRTVTPVVRIVTSVTCGDT